MIILLFKEKKIQHAIAEGEKINQATENIVRKICHLKINNTVFQYFNICDLTYEIQPGRDNKNLLLALHF